MKKKVITYTRNETDLSEVESTGVTGYERIKLGKTIAGKALGDTRSSRSKGRRASGGTKKLEEQAD